ncbi:LPS export ABC transporter periplasmic protein LptC [Marinobacter bohaiensis]|uniref:LPS export ABC transporter periplasmic protein LptC n=1 Tax=Marinobacter bohaiensis TaxID=2201898 RepID=UPI000DABD96B|nr:LPS export ABC transporter periplasmic protein LptC [Marinobacter bohaiensis]
MLSRLNQIRLRYVAIAVLAAVLIDLLWQSDEKSPDNTAEQLRGPDEPDSFVVNGAYQAYDEEGNVSVTITSPRIEQFDEQNRAHMQEPRATLIDAKSGIPWKVSAEEGNYLLERDVIDLTGNVVISRILESGKQGKLETPHLTLDNDKRIVHTDAPVILTDARGVTRATGMKAWIDKRIVKLQSQVEGQYELPSAQ